MNIRRLAVTASLSLGLALLLLYALNTSSSLVQAHAGTGATPTPRIGDEPAKSGDGDSFAGVARVSFVNGRYNNGQSQINQPVVTAPSSAGIANGDFENGRDGSWTEYSYWGYDIITTSLSELPHSGTWAAWLGRDDDEVSYISQSVTISAAASSLTFWNWIDSEDWCGYDFGWIQINNTKVQTITLCSEENTDGWVKHSVNLSAYAGQTVDLQIRVETDDFLSSNWFVDDVTFESLYYTYLPLVLRNFWVGYFDDFSNPSSGWASGENAWWKFGYLNGEYQVLLKQTDSNFWITPDLILPSDYVIEADVRYASSNMGTYGFIFGTRWDGAGDLIECYQFVVESSSQQYFLEKYQNGIWTTLIDWTYDSHINLGQAQNHLSVSRMGQFIFIDINGTWVDTATDNGITGPGRDAGLLVFSNVSAPVDVRFDNFSAHSP